MNVVAFFGVGDWLAVGAVSVVCALLVCVALHRRTP